MAQRQFRSDDTSVWAEKFGSGADGAYSSSDNATDAPVDSSCSGAAEGTSLTATNASFAVGKPILIHQTRGTGAGNWELNVIAGYTAGTITTKYDLCNTYTDSGASQAQVIQLPQYSSFTQNTGHTLTAKAWDGNVGGIIAFLCKGDVSIQGTLTAAEKGFRGGTGGTQLTADTWGVRGESSTAAGTNGASANGMGSGGGESVTDSSTPGTSGGGGHASNGSAGSGSSGGVDMGAVGGTGGHAELTTMLFGGSAGGAGRNANVNPGRKGGNSGGIIAIFAKSISEINSITVTGQAGANGGGGNVSGAGGGAGGSVLLKFETGVLGTNKIVSLGGAGGSAGGWAGGAGSVGRIHADYSGSITGTTNPTIDTRLDATIKAGGTSSMFLVF